MEDDWMMMLFVAVRRSLDRIAGDVGLLARVTRRLRAEGRARVTRRLKRVAREIEGHARAVRGRP